MGMSIHDVWAALGVTEKTMSMQASWVARSMAITEEAEIVREKFNALRPFIWCEGCGQLREFTKKVTNEMRSRKGKSITAIGQAAAICVGCESRLWFAFGTVTADLSSLHKGLDMTTCVLVHHAKIRATTDIEHVPDGTSHATRQWKRFARVSLSVSCQECHVEAVKSTSFSSDGKSYRTKTVEM